MTTAPPSGDLRPRQILVAVGRYPWYVSKVSPDKSFNEQWLGTPFRWESGDPLLSTVHRRRRQTLFEAVASCARGPRLTLRDIGRRLARGDSRFGG